ncbi:MAG TPA: hypothetical protein VJS30_28830 [Paraburkholderia sp.]|nr:hypothetical protein [Paraburkholderia sp.]
MLEISSFYGCARKGLVAWRELRVEAGQSVSSHTGLAVARFA